MTTKKFGKILLVWLCIITMIMPFGTEVLAAALTKESTTAILEAIPYHQGGAESTGLRSDNYDTKSNAYRISGINLLKIIQKDDHTYADTLYCVNAGLSFSITESYNYRKVADDFKIISNSEVKKWADSVGISTENYNALIYLLENLYLKKIDTSYKDAYIAKAFATIIEEEADQTPPTTVELIKSYLTDDDIDVIQQWAIWHFTNGTNSSNTYYKELYKTLGTIEIRYPQMVDGGVTEVTENISSIRQRYAGILYNYLVTSAKNAAANPNGSTKTYPAIDKTKTPTSDVDGKYYKVGPFKVNSGTDNSNFNLSLTAEGGNLSNVNYKIYVDGKETNTPFNQIFDKEYYIYIPIENNTITSIKLSSNRTSQNISLWQGEHDTRTLQPVILITGEPVTDEVSARIEPKYYDLALRKFIVSINGEATTGRTPVPTADSLRDLANGTVDTAEYTHSKNPLKVKKGDKIIYEFRIYNEGDIGGIVGQISDYLPNGLTMVDKAQSSVNSKYNWNEEGTTLSSTYLSGTTIPAFNKTNLTLSYGTIQLECEVTGDLEPGTILTNVAEIMIDDGDDKDSSPASINKNTIPENYTGNTSNKEDLTDSNYYYKGLQDDDDFEKLVIEEPVIEKKYDLALRKFVVSINGEATTGRTPIPTADSLRRLANGTIDTAEYTHSKNPLKVKKGDRVVFEFRIYNEGEVDAIVGQISDYLPDGLTVVDKTQSTVNSRYNWSEDGTTLNNTYLSGTKIPAFDKTNLTLSYGSIQLECEVTGNLAEGTILTNVAEIIIDDGDDKDSEPGSINKNTITEDFTGNTSNKEDLTDSDYHYKGLQDDDDFEKLVIEGRIFDLSLKKFISKVNDQSLSREPEVDVSPLNNGREDAKYTTTKTPVNVETGDIVTFTLRIYNEGEVSGYAEQITDYIPEGLGFLVNYNINYDNRWAISPDSNSVKLSTILNGMKNVKISDFKDIDKLEDVEVVLGKTKVTTNALASSTTSDANLIKNFDGNTLSYKDVQISCIVVTEDEIILKNIAAITGEKDEDKNPVETDRGSKDKDSTPEDDIDPDKYTTGNEDDDDYDVVKTDKKDFDLSLQKFITGLNNEEVTDRVPTITKGEDGNLQYVHTKDPLRVGNGDLVTYTIRVYNEGQKHGYASEVSDTIPTGLVFVQDNEINKNYGWKMYDKSGNETEDVNQAVSVKTTYLSKENSEDNLIKAFDPDMELSSTNPDYKDLKLVFKVDETKIDKTTTTDKRILINIAEISKNTDKDGNDIQDKDSTPGNGDPDEDDIDREQVYVKYFDLALKKDLTKALLTTDGNTTELNVAEDDTIKVEIHKKKLPTTTIKFVYNIKITNEGEIEGFANEISDYIPQGLLFVKADNPDWEQVENNKIVTNALAKTLLQPGESASVPVVLTWDNKEENMGKFVNVAEISDDWNPYDSDDVDSTPDNLVPGEDDIDDAPVYVSIITGLTERPYIVLTSAVLLILGAGILLIKKYVLSDI